MADDPSPTASGGSVDPEEIARFAAMAERWWDPSGAFRPLHQLNPVRIAFIRDHLAARRGSETGGNRPLAGLRILDVGCGGGLIAEPMARLGADVVAIDAAARNIAIAQSHAAESGLAIDYRCTSAEELARSGLRFDAVLALEIVEHVADLDVFVAALARLTEPGGRLVLATLNRTAKSFAFAILGAEYLLRWLPRGTHRWSKFVRPSELAQHLRRHGYIIDELTGVVYDPLAGRWSLSRDLGVNFMAIATRA